MCESTMYLEDPTGKYKLLEDIVKIDVESTSVICTTILGEQKRFDGVRIKFANLLDHEIVLAKI
jgi:predicted RNA-binding protein